MNMDKENIVMIVIWLMVFLGCSTVIMVINPMLIFDSAFNIFCVAVSIIYIGISLHYLTRRIFGG